MTLQTLQQQIISKKFDNQYIFIGEEVGIRDIYIGKISEMVKSFELESAVQLFEKLRQKGFIKERVCYIIRYDTDWIQQEKYWDEVQNLIGDNIVIFVYLTLDKRGKYYKKYQDKLVEFEKLNIEMLEKYVQKEIGLSGTHLAEVCDCDYSRIMLECNKLEILSRLKDIPIDQAFVEALNDGTIHQTEGDVTFNFIDAVCHRQKNKTYELWDELLNYGTTITSLLSLIYFNLRSMLLVQICEDRDVCGTTGLTAWQVKMAKEKMGKYSDEELVETLKEIRKLERGIKTGDIEQTMAIDMFLVKTL